MRKPRPRDRWLEEKKNAGCIKITRHFLRNYFEANGALCLPAPTGGESQETQDRKHDGGRLRDCCDVTVNRKIIDPRMVTGLVKSGKIAAFDLQAISARFAQSNLAGKCRGHQWLTRSSPRKGIQNINCSQNNIRWTKESEGIIRIPVDVLILTTIDRP